MTRFVNLSFQAANFFVTHLDVKAVLVQFQNRLFKCATNGTVRAFPILFLHNFSRAHFFDGGFFKRCLNPEFKFRRGRKDNVNDFFAADSKPVDVGVTVKQIHEFALDVDKRISQDGA